MCRGTTLLYRCLLNPDGKDSDPLEVAQRLILIVRLMKCGWFREAVASSKADPPSGDFTTIKIGQAIN